jgi:hypothetical protein
MCACWLEARQRPTPATCCLRPPPCAQGKYLRTALQHSHLLPSFKAHLGTALAGLACFACEDVATEAWGWPPVLHSLWHCLSAVAMGCTHALFGHIEQCLEMALLAEGMQVTAAGGL